MRQKIAVLIPCYNEEQTVGKVVADFRAALPDAEIHVCDNNSCDCTASAAQEAGATVCREPRQGKGNALRRLFRRVDADIYVMVDGDDTYPASAVQALLEPVRSGEADVACGDRISGGLYAEATPRPLHGFGNRLVRWLINRLFAARLADIMTGYRVMTREFVRNYPLVCEGFEVETSMTIHALHKGWRITEVPIAYRARPEGSNSKLHTFHDGARILATLFGIFKDYRPMPFFGGLACLFFLAGIVAGVGPIRDYLLYQYVYKVPSAVLASSLMLVALFFFFAGLILDTNVKHFDELYQIQVERYRESQRKNGR